MCYTYNGDNMKNKASSILIIIFIIMIFVMIAYISIRGSHVNIDYGNAYDEISYDVPKEFERDEDSYYIRDYTYNGDKIYCNINITGSEKGYYDNFNKWFKGNIFLNLNDEVGEVKEVDLNNTKAYYVEVKSNGTINYYYGVESSNHYYLIKFYKYDYLNGDRTDTNENPCNTALDYVIPSIKIK